MYVSTSSKILNHLDRVEGILKEDSKTSFYSKSKDSYKKLLFKLLKIVNCLIGLFPEFSQYLEECKFENISIRANRAEEFEFNSKTLTEASSKRLSEVKDNQETFGCEHTCFFQSICKFYQSTSNPDNSLNSKDFTLSSNLPNSFTSSSTLSNSKVSSSNIEDISEDSFSLQKEIVKEEKEYYEKVSKDSHTSFYTRSPRIHNTNIEVDVSPIRKKSLKKSNSNREEVDNRIDNRKSKYSSTSNLAIVLNNSKFDADFEELVIKDIYQRNNKELPSNIDEIIRNRIDDFSYTFTSENSRDLYNIFSSIYNKKKTKDIKFAVMWLNTLYIEKAKSPTSQKYFNPSGVPGKLISFILADAYYCNHDNDDKRVWNELIHWCDRYDSKFRWSAPKCTSASVLKKLDLTHSTIASAYRRWENMCYMFNTQTISEDSPLRLYPSQFLKKVRSLKILTDDELYALI